MTSAVGQKVVGGDTQGDRPHEDGGRARGIDRNPSEPPKGTNPADTLDSSFQDGGRIHFCCVKQPVGQFVGSAPGMVPSHSALPTRPLDASPQDGRRALSSSLLQG